MLGLGLEKLTWAWVGGPSKKCDESSIGPSPGIYNYYGKEGGFSISSPFSGAKSFPFDYCWEDDYETDV